MKYQMIVARYKENIDWIKNLKIKNLDIIIYNKFYDEQQALFNETGRESHTYLHHIYHNYDNLSDYTIFTQANPFDHSPDFIEKLEKIILNNEEMDFFSFITFFGEKSIFCDLDGYPNHPSLNLKKGTDAVFTEFLPGKIEFYPGAIFMVSKKNILNRSRQFYKKCLELSCDKEWKDNYGNYSCGYFFERMWKYIFVDLEKAKS